MAWLKWTGRLDRAGAYVKSQWFQEYGQPTTRTVGKAKFRIEGCHVFISSCIYVFIFMWFYFRTPCIEGAWCSD